MTSQSMKVQALSAAGSPRARGWAQVLATEAGTSGLVLRLALAVVMLPHGAQKLLGWFGGYGWTGTMGFLTDSVGLPTPVAAGVILLEAFGPLLLLAGLLTRPIALGFAALMAGAIATVHAQHGFFMNWSGAQQGEGFEFHLLAIGIALALTLQGAGSLSLDRRLAAKAS